MACFLGWVKMAFPGWFKGLDGGLGRFLFRESEEIPCPHILKKWWRNAWCLSFIESQEAQGSIYYIIRNKG